MRWLAQVITRLFSIAVEHPAVRYVIRATIIVAIILIAVRIGYSFFLAHRSDRLGVRRRGPDRTSDWWATAQRLAAEGDYTAAAHALYLALLTAAALRGLVSLHDSKTTGDYLRELRRAANRSELNHFTDFTRSYETVIYGIGSCDSARFTRLRALAASMLGQVVNPGSDSGADAVLLAGSGR